MSRPTTDTKLDENVKSFVDSGYKNLLDFDNNLIFFGVGIGVFTAGFILSCIPTPPTLILGGILMLLPLVVYGGAWGIVAGTDLVNRICCAIKNKYLEWKKSRHSTSPEGRYVALPTGSSSFQGSGQHGSGTGNDATTSASYRDPREAASHVVGDKEDNASSEEFERH